MRKPSHNLSRRLIIGAAATSPLLLAGAPRAKAASPHYPMACDPDLVMAVREAAALFLMQTGIAIHVLPTAPALVVPQMTHEIQNDIVMSRADILDAVAAAGFSAPGAPRPRFRGQLVFATLADAPGAALGEALTRGTLAIVDRTAGRPQDDMAVLAAMGIKPVRTLGALDSGEVAFLVATGVAGAGLMLMSDVRANPALKEVRAVPTEMAPPVIYVAATTRAPRRPEPEAFVRFLAGADGAAILGHFGVELMA